IIDADLRYLPRLDTPDSGGGPSSILPGPVDTAADPWNVSTRIRELQLDTPESGTSSVLPGPRLNTVRPESREHSPCYQDQADQRPPSSILPGSELPSLKRGASDEEERAPKKMSLGKDESPDSPKAPANEDGGYDDDDGDVPLEEVVQHLPSEVVGMKPANVQVLVQRPPRRPKKEKKGSPGLGPDDVLLRHKTDAEIAEREMIDLDAHAAPDEEQEDGQQSDRGSSFISKSSSSIDASLVGEPVPKSSSETSSSGGRRTTPEFGRIINISEQEQEQDGAENVAIHDHPAAPSCPLADAELDEQTPAVVVDSQTPLSGNPAPAVVDGQTPLCSEGVSGAPGSSQGADSAAELTPRVVCARGTPFSRVGVPPEGEEQGSGGGLQSSGEVQREDHQLVGGAASNVVSREGEGG
ncbi:unnamed protein product, partial [Amoebophrya sp. A25]